jgi:hypothetical protein
MTVFGSFLTDVLISFLLSFVRILLTLPEMPQSSSTGIPQELPTICSYSNISAEKDPKHWRRNANNSHSTDKEGVRPSCISSGLLLVKDLTLLSPNLHLEVLMVKSQSNLIKVKLLNNRAPNHAMLSPFLMSSPRSLVNKMSSFQAIWITNHVSPILSRHAMAVQPDQTTRPVEFHPSYFMLLSLARLRSHVSLN